MTTELHWMILTVLMTGLFWMPYILDRITLRGLVPAIADRKPESGSPHSLWAQRAIKAHTNAVENLAIFVPAVLALQVLGVSTPVTRVAVIVYFLVRLVHFVVYTAGIPVARTLAFAIGWGCQMALIASALRLI